MKKSIIILLILALIMCVIPVPVLGAGWTSNVTKPTYSDYTLMIANITGTWSWATGLIASNQTSAITAATANLTALKGNAITVMAGITDMPFAPLTTTFQQLVMMSGQSLNLTIPSAGAYLIEANIRENISATTIPSGTYSLYALCEGAGGATPVTSSERLGTLMFGNTTNQTVRGLHFSWIYSNSTGSVKVGICAGVNKVFTGNWTVDSDAAGRSTLSYVKLP